MVKKSLYEQWTIAYSNDIDNLASWFDAFLLDREAQAMSKGTIYFYRKKLLLLSRYLSSQNITKISQISPATIRLFLIELAQSHNPGGVHAAYRTAKAFLNWYEREENLEGWSNPCRNIKPPKIVSTPLEPVSIETVKKLLKTCGSEWIGLRDQSILLLLLDAGLRAAELLALNLDDVDMATGLIDIRYGKGGKPRTVLIGRKTKKAIREYIRARNDDNDALFVSVSGKRLTYWGVNLMLKRRAADANVTKPGLHDFRRAFALNCLRNGMDVYSLQRLMGHSDLQVLRRYLAQTDDDLHLAHAKASPVDNGF